MALPRFFVSNENATGYLEGHEVEVRADSATLHHAYRVLRIRPGERIEIVSRDVWDAYEAKVIALSDDHLIVSVLKHLSVRGSRIPFDLIWGWAKQGKNDVIVRQATEIGCERLIPVIFDRCVVKAKGASGIKRMERLNTIIESAAAQSHRWSIPTLEPIQTFGEMIGTLETYDAVIVAWEEKSEPMLSQVVDEVLQGEPERIALVIGPEGGIERDEIDTLVEHGALLASMGPSILRVETACIAGCAVLADRIQTVQGHEDLSQDTGL
ncbi:MAG: 16S rRNA (uracil(1498)-N(3))-methyltransferase [Actinomycetia bacterium]|nr:16S rRNA (uracil(1498)-N(3))-methyltransferase [Actinomycetes bacterium]